LREQVQHSVSCYRLNGEQLKNPFDRENLFAVLMGMERYMPDSNLLGSVLAAGKPENRNKAFILGHTVIDETENLKALLFGHKRDISNNNLFTFGFVGPTDSTAPVPYLMIHRLDARYAEIFDKNKLRKESCPRAKRTDAEYLADERKHMADVLELKLDVVHRILGLTAMSILPPDEFCERKRRKLIEIIHSKAPGCFKDYRTGTEVASFCYAALLLEPDDVGEKTRNEFNDPHRRNIFGDIRLIQNALWLQSRILSNDRAIKRMVEYIGTSGIVVTSTV
jgi:hypothetical protein